LDLALQLRAAWSLSVSRENDVSITRKYQSCLWLNAIFCIADVSASNFGVITTTLSTYATGRGTPRELQLSLKIVF
jgi:hypothetical protein